MINCILNKKIINVLGEREERRIKNDTWKHINDNYGDTS